MSNLMTTKEASEYLQLSYMTLYKLAQQGDIPAYKLGGHWRFNKTVLDEWFANKSQVIDKNASQDTSQETPANDQLIAELLELRQRIDNLASADKERSLIEDSLKFSEEKLRNFMESSNDLFFLLDSKLNIIEVNKAAIKHLPAGMNRKNAAGKNILDIMPGIKEHGWYEQYRAVLKTGEPLEISDIILDHGFGEAHMSMKVLKVGSGLGVIATDITELKLLESLKDSEIFNASLLDNAPNPILVYEADTAIRYVNQALEKLTGFSLDELTGRKIPYPWWQEDTMEKVLASFKDTEFSETKRVEIQFKKKNGEPFWVELNAKAIKKNDKTSYFIANWADITERKNTETALRDSEEKYRALVEQSFQGIMILQDGRIAFANGALAQEAGYSVEQMLSFSSQEVFEFIHPDDRECVLSRMRERLEGKEIPPRYEFRLVEKSGTIHWVEMYSQLISYAGRPAFQVTVIEITNRKAAELALLQEKNFSEAIINRLPGVFYLIDENVRFIRWNKNLEIESEYSSEELANLNPLALFRAEDRQLIEDKINETHKTGRASVDIQAISKSGKAIPYYLTGEMITLGTRKYIAGIGIDMSVLKQNEEALRKKQISLQTLIDKAIFDSQL